MMLPSQKQWVEDSATKLLQGQKVLLRALPSFGKTHAIQHVAEALGITAFVIQGRSFTEENQTHEATRILEECQRLVDEYGSAQLLFDDYDRAVRRSRGASLQTRLVGLLIDSRYARDVGCLLTARKATTVHLDTAGSPLLSRMTEWDLPEWSEADLPEGVRPPDILAMLGNSASLLDRAQSGQDGPSLAPLVESFRAAAPTIAGDLTHDMISFLRGAQTTRTPDDVGSLAVSTGTFSTLFRVTGLDEAIREVAPGWPADLADSARQFAQLCEGHPSVIWCDRYLYKDISLLSRFLNQLRPITDARVRLLGAGRVGNTQVDVAQVTSLASSVNGVEARFMSPMDYRTLHDRHLAVQGQLGGWVIPIADVVIGQGDPGSAVASRARRFGVNYDDIWRRAVSPSS